MASSLAAPAPLPRKYKAQEVVPGKYTMWFHQWNAATIEIRSDGTYSHTYPGSDKYSYAGVWRWDSRDRILYLHDFSSFERQDQLGGLHKCQLKPQVLDSDESTSQPRPGFYYLRLQPLRE